MKRFTGMAVLALGWLALESGAASAAWNNVFQATCNTCKSSTSYYFAPAAACCPTISYRQRCCYEPVVTYKMETRYEPVTTYRTSYYWEPVTSYKYTSYYDPCTGCCQQVATPCTSYRLRSQCNAVQSYVQRCQMVPVTSYRQSCYLEPVVTYAAPACPTVSEGAAPATAVPGVTETPGGPARMPSITENDGKQNIPPQNLPGGTGYRRAPAPAPVQPRTPVRLDRTTSAPANGGEIQGVVVFDDRITPRGNAKLLFVSMAKQGPQQTASADASGRFAVNLSAGDWLMYVTGNDGKPEYHSQVSVRDRDTRTVTVVSR